MNYCKNYVKEFNDKFSVEVISSAYGTGKTTRVIEYLKEKEGKMLFISVRRTSADDAYSRMEGIGFESYLNFGGAIPNKDRVILQVESLWKMDWYPDYLVVDEITSVLSQLTTSPHHKDHLVRNNEYFAEACKRCKKLIVMDADIDSRTFEFLKVHKAGDRIRFQKNRFKPRKDWKAYAYADEFHTISVLKDKLEAGENICVITGSQKRGYVLEQLFKDWGYGYKFYHSESDDYRYDIRNCNKRWKDFRIIMFTSTITTGVDFHEEYFDSLFVFGTSLSCHVRDIGQMMNRVRKLRKEEIHYFNKSRCENRPTKRREVRTMIEERLRHANKERRKLLDKSMEVLLERHMKSGVYKPKWNLDNDYFTELFIANLTEINQSRTYYNFLFKKMLEKQKIEIIKVEYDPCPKMKSDYDWAKYRAKEGRLKEYNAAEELTVDDFVQERERMRRIETGVASRQDKIGSKKEEFLRLFKEDSVITSEDYEEFGKRVRQLKRMRRMEDLSVADIAKRDVVYAKKRAEYEDPEFDRMKIVMDLCSILGLQSYEDTKTTITSSGIKELIPELSKIVDGVRTTFKIRKRQSKQEESYKSILGLIDTVFDTWMCASLKVVGLDRKQSGGEREKIISYRLTFDRGFMELVEKMLPYEPTEYFS